MNFVDFLIKNYIYIMIVLVILILIVIGFIADKSKKKKQKDAAINKNEDSQPLGTLENTNNTLQNNGGVVDNSTVGAIDEVNMSMNNEGINQNVIPGNDVNPVSNINANQNATQGTIAHNPNVVPANNNSINSQMNNSEIPNISADYSNIQNFANGNGVGESINYPSGINTNINNVNPTNVNQVNQGEMTLNNGIPNNAGINSTMFNQSSSLTPSDNVAINNGISSQYANMNVNQVNNAGMVYNSANQPNININNESVNNNGVVPPSNFAAQQDSTISNAQVINPNSDSIGFVTGMQDENNMQ